MGEYSLDKKIAAHLADNHGIKATVKDGVVIVGEVSEKVSGLVNAKKLAELASRIKQVQD